MPETHVATHLQYSLISQPFTEFTKLKDVNMTMYRKVTEDTYSWDKALFW